jgi:heme-degrading monooxygenase HmoA
MTDGLLEIPMSIVSQTNRLPAEFAVFLVKPEEQEMLVEQVTQTIESTLRQCPGFVSGSVICSRDGLRVTSYVQWANQASYVATQPIANFEPPDVHLFEIFEAEPKGSELHLATGMDGLINFGIFKMKQPENQPRFIELFKQALNMVSGQPGLISTHAHRSLDGWRCINFGYWRSLEDYTLVVQKSPESLMHRESHNET